MIPENMTVKKTRYVSFKLNGEEMYVEDITPAGSMKEHLKACRERLKLIRKAMPNASWSITIEQQWKERGNSHFQIMDVETEELQEQVL